MRKSLMQNGNSILDMLFNEPNCYCNSSYG